jgi:hypothetical protein
MKRYQETWVKGAPQGHEFQRECASRYEPIKKFLENFHRPFSVMDIGANMGYFSFRIAEDFPHATVIMVENKDILFELCQLNDLPNVAMLNTHLSGNQLEMLSRCENIDVVMALNVFHHIPDWQTAVKSVFALGDHVIIETPGAGDGNALNPQMHDELYASLSAEDHELIHESDSHVSDAKRYMMLFKSHANNIVQQTIDSEERGAPALGEVVIQSDFNEKFVEIHHMGQTPTVEKRAFVPGMNLWNWKLLNGCWPTNIRDRIISENAMLDQWHDDLTPWNFILSGANCTAIDVRTKSWKTEPDENSLQRCLDIMFS